MQQLAPVGDVYQAGTLSANPVAMTAGLATLRRLTDRSAYARLEALGSRLEQRVEELDGVEIQRVGSLFWLVPADAVGETIRRPDQFPPLLTNHYAKLFRDALAAGIYLPPSAFEIGFLSLAHTSNDVEDLAALLADKKKPPEGGKKL
jgi:glutamate-1-semialdehyde 2,1-aminomutase